MDSLKILLAEDNRMNRVLAIKLLERRGHRVTAAFNGAEAIEALERESFDVVLMDVHMPEVDGLEATRRIRACADERRTVPIIAVTAHTAPDDRERCLDAGMDDFVEKPLRIDALTEAIERAIAVR